MYVSPSRGDAPQSTVSADLSINLIWGKGLSGKIYTGEYGIETNGKHHVL